MSIDVKNVEAYNVKLKQKELMKVKSVVRTAILKDGVPTGKYRYRLAGVGSDGTGMSRFVKEDDAKRAAKQLKSTIQEGVPKSSSGGKRRTCKEIGRSAEERCEARRASRKKRAGSESETESETESDVEEEVTVVEAKKKRGRPAGKKPSTATKKPSTAGKGKKPSTATKKKPSTATKKPSKTGRGRGRPRKTASDSE